MKGKAIMKLFLTSSISGSYIENGVRKPCPLDDSNQFVDNLKKALAGKG